MQPVLEFLRCEVGGFTVSVVSLNLSCAKESSCPGAVAKGTGGEELVPVGKRGSISFQGSISDTGVMLVVGELPHCGTDGVVVFAVRHCPEPRNRTPPGPGDRVGPRESGGFGGSDVLPDELGALAPVRSVAVTAGVDAADVFQDVGRDSGEVVIVLVNRHAPIVQGIANRIVTVLIEGAVG